MHYCTEDIAIEVAGQRQVANDQDVRQLDIRTPESGLSHRKVGWWWVGIARHLT
jgi:hypothetical protein